MISITIHPIDRAGKFEARLDGRLLCASQTPFLDAARVLIARDYDPADTLAMYRAGKSEPEQTGRLGEAAKLDHGPIAVKRKPTAAASQNINPVTAAMRRTMPSKPDPWELIRAGVAADDDRSHSATVHQQGNN